MTARAELRAANAQMHYTVKASDLPLSCPMPDMTLWNSHPRVYLPIETTGFAKCAYCGAEYTLQRAEHPAVLGGRAAQRLLRDSQGESITDGIEPKNA